jgi:hypothetical protein
VLMAEPFRCTVRMTNHLKNMEDTYYNSSYLLPILEA